MLLYLFPDSLLRIFTHAALQVQTVGQLFGRRRQAGSSEHVRNCLDHFQWSLRKLPHARRRTDSPKVNAETIIHLDERVSTSTLLFLRESFNH